MQIDASGLVLTDAPSAERAREREREREQLIIETSLSDVFAAGDVRHGR